MNKLSVALGVSFISPILFAKPVIVTTIKPVSMVVAAIAGDKVEIDQIVSSTASPHDFALRPSDLRKISDADTVVWVGDALEHFMEKPLENAGKLNSSIEWLSLNGMTLEEFAKGHDEHSHEEYMGHDYHMDSNDGDHMGMMGSDDHMAMNHDDHMDQGDEHHHDEEGYNHNGVNPHVWLSPSNAKVLAEAVTQRLVSLDAKNAAFYQNNLAKFEKGLAVTDANITKQLSSVKNVPYIVFHDGYGYFEHHYGLDHVGEVTVSPERKPGAKKVAELRDMIDEHKVQCVFTEPQFSPAIVKTLLDGTKVKSVPLDPLGTDITLNQGAYLAFLTEISSQFMSCLR